MPRRPPASAKPPPLPTTNAITGSRSRRRAHFASAAAQSGDTLPTIDELRWRLDVAISTSSLHRVLRPELTMHCELSDQRTRAFHVSKPRFNQLRYTAAHLLKEMQDLESKLPPLV